MVSLMNVFTTYKEERERENSIKKYDAEESFLQICLLSQHKNF